MVGIAAFGAYIPRLRLQRASIAAAHAWFNPALKGLAKGERSFASWDEDVVTMAVEAARDCLDGRDRAEIASLSLASTTAPFADRQNAGIVKEALNLDDAVSTFDLGGSQRAGVSGLIQAIRAAACGPVLCIASEKRATRPGSEGEMTSGDGAAALLVAPGEGVARHLGDHSVSADFVDHFRGEGEKFDYGWEARWIRDEGYARLVPKAVAGALAKAGLAAGDIDRFILPAPMRGVAEAMAKAAGIRPEAVADGLAATVGETGVAHPLLMLAHALEQAKAGERVLVAGFGSGCDVVIFERTAATAAPRLGVSGWLARRKADANYMKYLVFNGLIDIERGMRAEFDQKQPLTALWRNRKTVLGLVGGRCTKTGTIQFPKTDISVNPNDRSVGTQEDHPLADRLARILTYTADRLTYTLDPPAHYGMVEFEEGGRMNAEFCDVEPEDVEVGRLMRMMFRIKAIDEQRGFRRYFWKAAPAD
ncbi:hydroxymethylglutaryl-CoA synthase family protein [Enterovirga aerilata]|uniref:3-hydroxy-3-methylglutaryl CoA synthase n=1 Tax=Enterovirga aerilata TaxID=2730920 RepID=A0A849I686_9HYPH|nr:3-oxoacyl-[acyl-carrier-protein] synthase III C-terminal domain-containing protein [Enterovirga sp. DB1703]NNM71610.1 3-hydroxy-3-methylglutaryl CoA synthase [Enterovirga sp. DB1703]